MVLTHQYLRYAHHSVWGVVASPTSNILLLKNSVIVCPALEKVTIHNFCYLATDHEAENSVDIFYKILKIWNAFALLSPPKSLLVV